MSEQQILASLEITDHEVRLLVGEYYNTRVNVFRTAITPIDGMDGLTIKKRNEVVAAIKETVDSASKVLNLEIKRVLLAIPAYRTMKKTVRVSKGVENYDRKVYIDDLQILSKKAYEYPKPEDKELINWMPIKYYTNKIAFKHLPLGQFCDVLDGDFDLFMADKMTAYDYARCVSEAGLSIVDVCLDVFAIAKEASLFELSVSKAIVIADIEHDHSTLAILHNGAMEAVKMIKEGYGQWEDVLSNNFPIEHDVAHKLVFLNADLSSGINDDSPVHLWRKENKTYQLSLVNLNDAIKKPIKSWCNAVDKVAGNIFSLKDQNVQFILTGEGAGVEGLAEYVSSQLNVETSVYTPDTIGARDPKWSCCLGMIYSFMDIYPLYSNKKMSVDVESVQTETVKEKKEEDVTITKKIKNLFSI